MSTHRSRPALAALALLLAGAAGCTPASTVDPAPEPPTAERTGPGGTPTPAALFPTELFHEASLDPLDAQRSARLQAALDAATADPAVAGGVSAAVVDVSAGMWTGAAGSADGVRPMSPEDQLAAGALTQPVVAAAVMRLVEDGRVDLDEQLTEYLPDGLDWDPWPATVRDHLAQTTYHPNFQALPAVTAEIRADPARRWTPAEVLDRVDPRPTSGPMPGTNYSATNYLLLGLLVEEVTGTGLGTALRSDVLSGPGLERMVVQPHEAPSAPMAAQFDVGPDPLGELARGGGYLPSLAEVTAAGGAGAIASDAPSLARWWTALCGGHVVSRSVFMAMLRVSDADGAAYGLGMLDMSDVLGTSAVGGFQRGPGYSSVAACLPDEGAVVVVMTNQGGPVRTMTVASELARALAGTAVTPSADTSPAPAEPLP